MCCPYAHGNATGDSKRKYIRTCPSVTQSLKYSCTMETAVKCYILEVSSLKHLPLKHPRSIKQAKNIRSSILGQQRLSHDVLYNLHELAIDNPEYIHTHPNLVCICGQQALFEEFDRLLLTDSQSPQLLSYDTTFKLGDFYLSTLAFCHILLTQSPAIPLCFLIHDRKFQSSHDELFSIRCRFSPTLLKTRKPIVTDEKQAIVNTIQKHLPFAAHLRCWNCVIRDARRWLSSHGVLKK